MKRVVGLMLCGVLLLTGCSGHQQQEKTVTDSNMRVTRVMGSLEETKTTSSFLEDRIKEAVVSGDNKGLLSPDVAHFSNQITVGLVDFAARLRGYLDDVILSQQTKIEDGVLPKDTEVYTRESLYTQYVTMHYFVDDKTGKVEQAFIFRSPTGENKVYSFYWVGGAYIERKEMGWN